MALMASSPPSKKAKMDSDVQATRYGLPPKVITRSLALAEANHEPMRTQLRMISWRELSFEEASKAVPAGFEICVSPHGVDSNKTYKETMDSLAELRRFKSSFDLYMSALSTSVRVCAVDLLMFPLAVLDYHVRRGFCIGMQNSGNATEFRRSFVGKGKEKPFKGALADQMRYMFLLKAADALEGKRSDLSVEKRSLLTAYESLLQQSENSFMATLEAFSLPTMETNSLRRQVRVFLSGQEKRSRDSGAHLFTELIWKDGKNPLEKQALQDPLIPPELTSAFDLTKIDNLFNLGLKVIVLEDFEKKLSRLDHLDCELVRGVPDLNRAAIELIRCFIKRHVGHAFKEPIRFTYGDLSGTLEINKDAPLREVDIKALTWSKKFPVADSPFG